MNVPNLNLVHRQKIRHSLNVYSAFRGDHHHQTALTTLKLFLKEYQYRTGIQNLFVQFYSRVLYCQHKIKNGARGLLFARMEVVDLWDKEIMKFMITYRNGGTAECELFADMIKIIPD